MITRKRLRELLDYNPRSGRFHWKIARPGLRAGALAGCRKDGYVVIRLDGVLYRAHRLAWFLVWGRWPRGDIDHKNGRRSDNRWMNLRRATRRQNLQNSRIPYSNNTSGFRGVSLHKQTGKYRATISIDGKRKHLGLFSTAKRAHHVYIEAKKMHHFA